MKIALIIAAYGIYAAFWIRFLAHGLLWWNARTRSDVLPMRRAGMAVYALTAADVLAFARLFKANPALWFGEWVFHGSFLLVMMRHLRYFLNPVPEWVWSVQIPGLIAGYILPLSLIYILAIRLLGTTEKYSARSNLFLLFSVLAISTIGILMRWIFKPDLVDVKFFTMGILTLTPAEVPRNVLFLLHFGMVLVLVPFLPTHIFTAPFVMFEARKRDAALSLVIHDR